MVDKSEVLRIAKLSHLHMNDADVQRVQTKFSGILNHVQQLNELDTKNVEPLFHFHEQMVPRPDETEAPIAVEKLMQNAPDVLDNSFRLPKVVGAAE